MSNEFVEWYRSMYGDTSEATGTGELPVIYCEDVERCEEMCKDMRREKLTEIIGPRRSKRIYKDRGSYKQTRIDYVLSRLRLGYSPIFKHISEKEDVK